MVVIARAPVRVLMQGRGQQEGRQERMDLMIDGCRGKGKELSKGPWFLACLGGL